MFIAHLPAGYICSTLLMHRVRSSGINTIGFTASCMLGAIAPDLDIFYFYLIDQRQHSHHSYFTHFPSTWVLMLACSAIWLYCRRSQARAALAFVFCLNGLVHMMLDTVVGAIQWGAPFTDRYFALFPVPALYQPWWLNFILHWSFALEIGILAWAIILCGWQRKTRVASLRAGL